MAGWWACADPPCFKNLIPLFLKPDPGKPGGSIFTIIFKENMLMQIIFYSVVIKQF